MYRGNKPPFEAQRILQGDRNVGWQGSKCGGFNYGPWEFGTSEVTPFASSSALSLFELNAHLYAPFAEPHLIKRFFVQDAAERVIFSWIIAIPQIPGTRYGRTEKGFIALKASGSDLLFPQRPLL